MLIPLSLSLASDSYLIPGPGRMRQIPSADVVICNYLFMDKQIGTLF